jgi:hypothetical protein
MLSLSTQGCMSGIFIYLKNTYDGPHGKKFDKMTNHQINYIIWIPLLVFNGLPVVSSTTTPPWEQPAHAVCTALPIPRRCAE